jgi:nucleoside-diphosphate-sugar epimerase
MKILIVGGAGYLGGSVTDILTKTNHNIRIYDNLTYETEYRKPCPFVYGDILDRLNLKKQLEWADTVIWLAALVGDGACEINKEASFEINQNSVEWLSENFDGRIVFTSTCSVYGANQDLLNEQSPTHPLSTYALTKLNAETYLKNKNALIFRLGTLYGVSDIFSRLRLDLVVNTLTAKSHFTGKIKIFGGDQYRPLLHVKDAAQAILQAIESEKIGIYNIHNKNMTINDISKLIKQIYPSVIIETTEQLFEDSRNYQVDSTLARTTLNWMPKYSIEVGIQELKSIFDEQRIKNPDDSRYCNHLHLKLK